MIDVKQLQKIRDDFPQLDGPDYHYLDAAATSLTPQSVLDAVIDYYTHYRANVHRGLFDEAVMATKKYEAVRAKVAKFLNAKDEKEIIFNSGATESSNVVVRMFEESFKWEEEEKNIVTTEMEHHASLIPIQQLAQRVGLNLEHIPLSLATPGSFGLDYDAAEKLINEKTVIVSVMLASNVLGTVNDVRRIAKKAHQHGAVMIVDATAAAGHIPIDVEALDCDVLYFSGHKMMAPTGVGVLWVRQQLLEKLNPAAFGGHMISDVGAKRSTWAPIPERFEAGTKNIAGVIGLGAAIDYLERLGVGRIHEHVRELTAYAIARLEELPDVKVFAEHDVSKNIGIVSFVADWAHAHDIAEILSRDRVAVRAGHHCTIPLHGALKVQATTRASFHIYNSKEDVDALVEGLKKARAIFIQ